MDKKNLLKFILGFNIRQLRKRKNISLTDLAAKTDFSVSYLNEIEKGKKYPSFTKLIQLAQGLEIEVDQLVSSKLSRSLYPMLEFLESDIISYLPFHAFGIKLQDVFELMSQSPEKFASFLLTISQISKSYDLSVENLHKFAVRAFQEIHQNYFPEIEDKSREMRLSLVGSNLDKTISEKLLEQTLVNDYDYEVDRSLLTSNKETENIRSIFKDGKTKKLLINNKLDSTQKKFVLARELGYRMMNLPAKNIAGSSFVKVSFEETLNEFLASYFAGSLLIPALDLKKELDHFFRNEKIDMSFLWGLTRKFDTSVEVLFHRIMQVLPHHFGLENVFFLRMKLDTEKPVDDFFITKELHLSQLHMPHSNNLFEHYCRRWVSIKNLQRLKKRMGEHEECDLVFDAQVSHMIEVDSPYLCLSVSRVSRRKGSVLNGVTMGIAIDQKFRDYCGFLSDSGLKTFRVGQTCERCSELDCSERVVKPFIYEKKQRLKQKKEAIKNLLDTLD
jgi:transcriptional regulator with XRE-family HTH domain